MTFINQILNGVGSACFILRGRTVNYIIFLFSIENMSLQTQQILRYINLAREYPKYYVGLIEEQLVSFVDEINMQLERDVYYESIEGKTAWEEAKTFLNNQEPLRPFDFHQGLAKAATDHAKDIVKNHSNGHQGSDGSTFIDRIQRYCRKGKGSMIELLGTTHIIPDKNSIEIALINLIVDDGVANRGHRRALFSKDYKYIGADFIESEGQIFTVIAMTQANLEMIQAEPQSIATSTSHLKTYTQISSELKENQSILPKSKENCIDASSVSSPCKDVKSGQFGGNCQKSKPDSVWTLKNVTNEGKVQSLKRVVEQKANEAMYPEPSIFKEVNQSVYSNHSQPKSLKSQKQAGEPANGKSKQDLKSCYTESKNSITSPSKVAQIPVKQSSKLMKNAVSSQAQIKQSTISLKNSQQSIKSDVKNKTGTSQGFGVSSQVEKFKIKSSLNSPFLKGNTFSSSFSSNSQKKVVEKKETMRSWCEDQFMIKEITTVLKYEDGTIEDFVEKHSVLKNAESLLKQQAI